MDYAIRPYDGIGPIKFGMTPEQVHEILGEPVKTFKKNSRNTDDYRTIGFHVVYDEADACESITLFSPATPSFQDQQLIDGSFKTLKTWFQSQGSTVQHYDCGMIFLKFGINLYATDYNPNSDNFVEAVSISTLDCIERNASLRAKYPKEEATV
jgi:hypothetical protein